MSRKREIEQRDRRLARLYRCRRDNEIACGTTHRSFSSAAFSARRDTLREQYSCRRARNECRFDDRDVGGVPAVAHGIFTRFHGQVNGRARVFDRACLTRAISCVGEWRVAFCRYGSAVPKLSTRMARVSGELRRQQISTANESFATRNQHE